MLCSVQGTETTAFCSVFCLIERVEVLKERRVMTTQNFLINFRTQPCLKIRMLHVLGVNMCKYVRFSHTADEKRFVAHSESAKVRGKI